jgi:hypothetical protein
MEYVLPKAVDAGLESKSLQAYKLAAHMLVDNGMDDWRINMKDVTSFHAQTIHKPKVITWSTRALTLVTKEQFTGIMYHEIAHAIVGASHGHNRNFKARYYKLTGNMDYAGYAVRLNCKNWLTHCEYCDNVGSVNNTRGRLCRPCWTKKRERSVLTYTKNPMILVEW